MILLSSNPWKLLVADYNRNISVIDATYTVVSTTKSYQYTFGPVFVAGSVYVARVSQALEVTKFIEGNLTNTLEFPRLTGSTYDVKEMREIINGTVSTLVVVQAWSNHVYVSGFTTAGGNVTLQTTPAGTFSTTPAMMFFTDALFLIQSSYYKVTRFNLTTLNSTTIDMPETNNYIYYIEAVENTVYVSTYYKVFLLNIDTLSWRAQFRYPYNVNALTRSNAKGRGKNAHSGGLVFLDNNGGVGFLLDSERVNSTLSAAMGCSPTTELHIAEGVVYVGACSKVLAYGVTNNTKLWESATLESSLYNPFYNSGRLFVSNNNGKAYILNVFSNGAMTSVSSPSCNYQMSFFAFGTDVFALCSSYNKKVVRITPDNKMVETADTTNYIRGVANDDKAVYIIDDSGTLYTAKLTSFDKPWTGANTKVESATSTSPIGLSMIKENLYAGSYYSRLSGITPSSGKKMFELVTEGTTTPPFLFNGKLYFTTGSGYLYQMPTGTISAVGSHCRRWRRACASTPRPPTLARLPSRRTVCSSSRTVTVCSA